MSISWKVLAAAAAVTAVLSGCSSVSLDEGNKAGTLAGEQSAAQTTAVNPFLDPANPLYHRSVYFAFDSYEVSPEYAAVVEAHAKWLALGQKRSEAVLQRLQLLGIPSSRIEAVSFGKEKPIALGHSEEAWAQNRRADIVYPESVLKAQPAAK